MKDKLEKIRETLEFYATCKSQNSWEEFWKDIKDDGKFAQNGLTLLDSIIAELDSEELASDIQECLSCECNLAPLFNSTPETYEKQMKEAANKIINRIKSYA